MQHLQLRVLRHVELRQLVVAAIQLLQVREVLDARQVGYPLILDVYIVHVGNGRGEIAKDAVILCEDPVAEDRVGEVRLVDGRAYGIVRDDGKRLAGIAVGIEDVRTTQLGTRRVDEVAVAQHDGVCLFAPYSLLRTGNVYG